MTTNSKNIWIVAIVLAVIGAFYLGKHSTVGDHVSMNSSTTETTSDTTNTSTSSANGATTPKPSTPSASVKPTGGTVLTSGNTTGFHSTSDSTYHFTVKYPPTAKARNTFTTFHELGNNWRLFAGAANQGKAILEISLHSIDQGSYSTGKQTYPLYFTSMVRIGVSPNTKECYTLDSGYPNQKVTSVTINGTPWKKFSTSDAAMMKYTQVESYRTIHNNMCFAMEQIKNGTTYRDEKMSMETTDDQLAAYYNQAASVIKTFTFTR